MPVGNVPLISSSSILATDESGRSIFTVLRSTSTRYLVPVGIFHNLDIN